MRGSPRTLRLLRVSTALLLLALSLGFNAASATGRSSTPSVILAAPNPGNTLHIRAWFPSRKRREPFRDLALYSACAPACCFMLWWPQTTE